MSIYGTVNGIEDLEIFSRSHPGHSSMARNQGNDPEVLTSPSDGLMYTILKEVRELRQYVLKIDCLQQTIDNLNQRVEQIASNFNLSPLPEQSVHHVQPRPLEVVGVGQKSSKMAESEAVENSLDHRSSTLKHSSPSVDSRSNSMVTDRMSEVLPSESTARPSSLDSNMHSDRSTNSPGRAVQRGESSSSDAKRETPFITQEGSVGPSVGPVTSRRDAKTVSNKHTAMLDPQHLSREPQDRVIHQRTSVEGENRLSSEMLASAIGTEATANDEVAPPLNPQEIQNDDTNESGDTSHQPDFDYSAFKVKQTPRRKDNRFVYHKITRPSVTKKQPSPEPDIQAENESSEFSDSSTSDDEEEVAVQMLEEPRPPVTGTVKPTPSVEDQTEQRAYKNTFSEPEQRMAGDESDVKIAAATTDVDPMVTMTTPTVAATTPNVVSREPEIVMSKPVVAATTPIVVSREPVIVTSTPVVGAMTPVVATEPVTAVTEPVVATKSEKTEVASEESLSGSLPVPKERQFLENLTLKEANRAAECSDPKSDGADTIICIDNSDSMQGEAIELAREFLHNFLDGIEECAVDHALEENIAIVTFGKNTHVAQHLTNDYTKVRDAIEEMEIGGASPMMTGLVLCISAIYIRGGVVSFRNRKIMPRIILVSDGRITDSRIMEGPDIIHAHGMTEEEAIHQLMDFSERLKSEHRKVTCIPVGDSPNMSVLEGLCSVTGGEVACVADAGRLSKQFLLDTIVARVLTDDGVTDPDIDRSSLETIVRANQTGQDLTDEEMDVVHDLVTKELRENPGGIDPAGMEDGPPPVGTRVRRGRDWIWENQDDNMAGTIIGHKQRGLVAVEWDSGRKGKYRMGAEDAYDLRVVDEPRFLPEGMLGAVGVACRRGPDWEWDNQDGGEDQIGMVFKIEDSGIIHIRWQNGKRGNYRYGIHGKFDIEMCPGRQPVPVGEFSITESRVTPEPAPTPVKTRAQWQWEVDSDTWMDHSKLASTRIEELFQKRGRGTTLVDLDGHAYRVVIQLGKQRNTVSGIENNIRRQEVLDV